MFALVFLGFLGSVYGYSGWRLIPYLPRPWNLGALLILGLLLLAPLLLFRLRSQPGRLTWLADPLSWIAYGAMGFFVVSTSLLLLRDLLGLALTQLNLLDPTTRPFIDQLTFALAIAVTGWGVFQARRTPCVVEVEVPIADLPSAMSGLRIIQISDLHVGPTIKGPFVRKVVERQDTASRPYRLRRRFGRWHDRTTRTRRRPPSRVRGPTWSLFYYRQPRILFGRGSLDRSSPPPRFRRVAQRRPTARIWQGPSRVSGNSRLRRQ